MAGYFANGNCYPCPRTNLLPMSPAVHLSGRGAPEGAPYVQL